MNGTLSWETPDSFRDAGVFIIGCRRGLQMITPSGLYYSNEKEDTEVDGIYEESEPGNGSDGQNESPWSKVVIF
jgi:hypothetical protein